MDRRDALKKLGMGGATVVGATMVMSSPAIAGGGSSSARVDPFPEASITTSDETLATMNINLSLPSAPCPTGNPPDAKVEYRFNLQAIGTTTTTGVTLGGNQNTWNTGTTDTRLVTWNTDNDTYPTQSIRLRTLVRYTCRDFDGVSAAWVCKSFIRIFERDALGNVTVATSSSAVDTSAACDIDVF